MRKVFVKALFLLGCCVIMPVDAEQVITIPLSDSYTEGKVKICIYTHGERTETVQVDSYQKCKAVITVDAD